MLGSLVLVLSWRWLSRDYILRNLGFLLFLVALLLLYIAYGYEAERTVRQLYKVDAELKELKSEYTTTFSKLEVAKQQSNVADRIQSMGLKESLAPPKKIAISEKEKENWYQ